MKARDLFERSGAPTVEPPPTKTPTKEPAAPPKREPSRPNPFRRRERPTVIPKPKACYDSKALQVVGELLEVKLYANPLRPHAYQTLCRKCGKPKTAAQAPCPHCEGNRPPKASQSVTNPAPPQTGV